MPSQRIDGLRLLLRGGGSVEPTAQSLESGIRRMLRLGTLMLDQQGDAAFQRLRFGEAMSFAVAGQCQLRLGP
jgi:hypothetical protein